MSAINQMLRDLDKRGALGGVSGAAPVAAPAVAPNTRASAYAAVRLTPQRSRISRPLLLVGGAAALLPIAWATTQLERPAGAAMSPVVSPPAVVQVATAPVVSATVLVVPAAEAAVPASAEAAMPVPAEAAPAQATVALAEVAAPAPAAAWPEPRPTLPVALPVAAAPALAEPPRPAPAVAVRAEASATATPAAVPAPPRPALVALAAAPSPRPALPARAAALPAPEAEARARTERPRDTALALASPAAPRDEARIERRPTDARDDLTRAGEAMSIGRTSEAIALLRKVIQAEPDNERARLALLSLLAERGRDDTWRSLLADSARALPRRFGLAAAQGMAESGHFDESLAILRGLPESVRDTRYFSALGATHQQLNQHAEAVAAFGAALETASGSSPQLPSLLVAQAVSMQSLGQQAQARRNLERVRQMPEAAADMRDYATRELAQPR